MDGGGYWPPPFVTSWQGTLYTIPFGADRSGQEVLAWALAMPAVQSAMAEAVAHGATRRSDADAAYSISGYACAVIAFEFPGTSINDVQPIISVCTKMLDDGRVTTNIFGGTFGKTVVNGVEVPQIRDDVPGAFQVAVAWTEGTQQNQQTLGTLAVEGGIDDAFAVWWDTSRENQRYWTNAVLTDRSVAVSFINQVLIAAGAGTLGGAIAGLSVPLQPWTPVLGAGVGGMLGATMAATAFLNQPAPKPKMDGAESVFPLESSTRIKALGVHRPSWGQLKAAYR